jgi:hypothetical protein
LKNERTTATRCFFVANAALPHLRSRNWSPKRARLIDEPRVFEETISQTKTPGVTSRG